MGSAKDAPLPSLILFWGQCEGEGQLILHPPLDASCFGTKWDLDFRDQNGLYPLGVRGRLL